LNIKITLFVLLILPLQIISLTTSTVVNAGECSNSNCIQVQVKSNKGNALADMVVYLEPLSGQLLAQSSATVVIGQHNKSFTPYISISQSKSSVEFVNQDDITHHIYSAGSDNKFSFKIRAGQTHSFAQFNQAAEIAMGCNIHDWMSGYLLVVDTPYFAKTNAQGIATFSLNELGKYRIVLWHPQMDSPNEQNKMIIEKNLQAAEQILFVLDNPMKTISKQKSEDDFDFLSDY
jgi:plastocyanin